MEKIILLLFLPACLTIIVTEPPLETDYKYAYNIEDPVTGDRKSQHEIRQGDTVKGAYTVLGPDGTKRTVEYIADKKHGFKATIKEEPVENFAKPTNSHESLRYYKESDENVYFTPDNEVDRKAAFGYDKYFLPANEFL